MERVPAAAAVKVAERKQALSCGIQAALQPCSPCCLAGQPTAHTPRVLGLTTLHPCPSWTGAICALGLHCTVL